MGRAIVDSDAPEVRSDCAAGWKYTGTVLRAADEILGINTKPNREGRIPASGSVPFRPRRVCESTEKSSGLQIWWSDFDTACQAKRLREECGITHRLNVAIETVSIFSKDDDTWVKTVHIPMLDSFDPDEGLCREWPTQLDEAFELLKSWREEGAVVNVSCQMGKNRSGAVILLWLCRECGWELEAAVQHLRSVTALACGNPHLLAALTQILGVPDVKVPLNPAAEGGGWVCISPPGSPRVGGAAVFDGGFAAGGLEEAASRLAALGGGSGYDGRSELPQAAVGEERCEEEVVEEPAGDMGALFSELSDVD